ncbi:hypothetical protein L2E82_11446 [Cichorium intybus]|uniref:Uncharacterized protein n=1 Tax=Cichorium intybus TaxID=13427 RepID=A0ACB9GDY4_CICIN|nr:hypothetical protein L2E82_11446 [Cichorium intybus]
MSKATNEVFNRWHFSIETDSEVVEKGTVSPRCNDVQELDGGREIPVGDTTPFKYQITYNTRNVATNKNMINCLSITTTRSARGRGDGDTFSY